ncbi:hypothetical protein CPC08DRAFT_705524 [Agrocybe pediades]|nr:hypothetical protein CPC08DRAFT_705524 [Agrocybe pediades]
MEDLYSPVSALPLAAFTPLGAHQHSYDPEEFIEVEDCLVDLEIYDEFARQTLWTTSQAMLNFREMKDKSLCDACAKSSEECLMAEPQFGHRCLACSKKQVACSWRGDILIRASMEEFYLTDEEAKSVYEQWCNSGAKDPEQDAEGEIDEEHHRPHTEVVIVPQKENAVQIDTTVSRIQDPIVESAQEESMHVEPEVLWPDNSTTIPTVHAEVTHQNDTVSLQPKDRAVAGSQEGVMQVEPAVLQSDNPTIILAVHEEVTQQNDTANTQPEDPVVVNSEEEAMHVDPSTTVAAAEEVTQQNGSANSLPAESSSSQDRVVKEEDMQVDSLLASGSRPKRIPKPSVKVRAVLESQSVRIDGRRRKRKNKVEVPSASAPLPKPTKSMSTAKEKGKGKEKEVSSDVERRELGEGERARKRARTDTSAPAPSMSQEEGMVNVRAEELQNETIPAYSSASQPSTSRKKGAGKKAWEPHPDGHTIASLANPKSPHAPIPVEQYHPPFPPVHDIKEQFEIVQGQYIRLYAEFVKAMDCLKERDELVERLQDELASSKAALDRLKVSSERRAQEKRNGSSSNDSAPSGSEGKNQFNDSQEEIALLTYECEMLKHDNARLVRQVGDLRYQIHYQQYYQPQPQAEQQPLMQPSMWVEDPAKVISTLVEMTKQRMAEIQQEQEQFSRSQSQAGPSRTNSSSSAVVVPPNHDPALYVQTLPSQQAGQSQAVKCTLHQEDTHSIVQYPGYHDIMTVANGQKRAMDVSLDADVPRVASVSASNPQYAAPSGAPSVAQSISGSSKVS